VKLSDLIDRLVSIQSDMRVGLGADVEPVVLVANPKSRVIVGVAALDEDDFGNPILASGQPVVWIAVGAAPNDLPQFAPPGVMEAAE
jgi:hypothetical protein